MEMHLDWNWTIFMKLNCFTIPTNLKILGMKTSMAAAKASISILDYFSGTENDPYP